MCARLPTGFHTSCGVLMIAGACFLAHVLAMKALLAGVAAMVLPSNEKRFLEVWIVCTLAIVTRCIAHLAAARHQLTASCFAPIIFGALRALHVYAVFAMGQSLLQYKIAIYPVQGIKLITRNSRLDMPTR